MRFHLAFPILAFVTVFAPNGAHAQWQVNGVAVSTAALDQGHTAIAPDGSGGAIVAWLDSRAGVGIYQVYVQRINVDGEAQWPIDGILVCGASDDQSGPSVISDGSGGAIVAWRDGRAGMTSDQIYAQHIDAFGAVQWNPDGIRVCATASLQTNPRIVRDESGGAIICWEDYRNGNNSDIYSQHLDAAGVTQWTAGGIAVCPAAHGQIIRSCVPDEAGGVMITWLDYSYDARAQRLDASGVVQWTDSGVALCTFTEGQSNPMIVTDGSGGAFVTWHDRRSGNADVYAQRIDASGAVQWTAEGVPVCTAANNQFGPTVFSDGSGSATVVWTDYRSGTNYDVYAQRIDASAGVQWTSDGVPVCIASGNQSVARIVSDGAGGAIVTWMDYRNGSASDLYAQRINAAGVTQWNGDGVAICTAPSYQQSQTVISDGSGGAIIAWDDNRSSTNWDIYAQRARSDGSVPTPVRDAPLPKTFALHPNVPNPFNPTTLIRYDVPENGGEVSLRVYDVSGRLVKTLVAGTQSAGEKSVTWDGRDDAGRPVASGVYFYRFTAADYTKTHKMVLMK